MANPILECLMPDSLVTVLMHIVSARMMPCLNYTLTTRWTLRRETLN